MVINITSQVNSAKLEANDDSHMQVQPAKQTNC